MTHERKGIDQRRRSNRSYNLAKESGQSLAQNDNEMKVIKTIIITKLLHDNLPTYPTA